jgi:hypothetical protein
MTAQIREILYYNGEKYYLSSESLQSLLEIIGDEKPSSVVMISTACKRGYIGEWEIVEDKLFLIGLKGCPEEYEKFTMDFLFPHQKRVFAGWFIGEIKIPQGKVLVHADTTRLHEKDWYLEFKKGILVGSREVDNTKTFNPDDPYGLRDYIIDLP